MRRKNEMQILSLLVAAFSLIIGLFTIVYDTNRFDTENMFFMIMLSVLTISVVITYTMSVIKRINPKQYIYVSFTRADKEVANQVITILEKEFSKISKYRFEILTADKIPYGANMPETMQEFLTKANIVIVIVSENYLISNWCTEEFVQLSRMDKKIIPIVIDSYSHLYKLPKDISNIRALLIDDCKSDEDFKQRLIWLAKDLVRQRTD